MFFNVFFFFLKGYSETLNHFAWTAEGWMISENNFYELGINNLYDSVNVKRIWKPIVSHTSCIMQIV